MSRINQIQIRYEPVEDRIVLRLNTEDLSEFRFWITRRFAQLLSVSLMQLLSSSDEVMAFEKEGQQKAVMSFQHEEALANADFAKTFQGQPKKLPLGNDPVLLSKLTLKQTADGNPMLCMYPEQGPGIDLTLQPHLLHSISKLFADALQTSEWGVEFSIADLCAPVQESEKPVLLN